MPQIYGYAYHSPLILRNLIPARNHVPVYLEARWVASDLYKNVNPLLQECDNKSIVVLAGSLTILQSFLKTFPDIKQPIKVILFDFPGFLNPFKDALIEWIDCDHQAGGAWQTNKIKLSSFESLIVDQAPLDEEGKNLIFRMTRFVSRDRIAEIEQFQAYMPSNYKEMIDYDMTDADSDTNKANYDAAKDTSWKKKTFIDVLKDFMINVPKSKRQEVFNLILDYQLNKITKREYNTKIKPFVENSAVLKKTVITVRKWMDDTKHGRALHHAYLDYVSNLTRRSWKIILEESGLVDELDLLLVIRVQHRDTPDLHLLYSEGVKEVASLPSNMYAPECTVRWADGSLHYHAEPPDLQELFDL